MGGDGGVIASNRRYLRGAGTADKGGDRQKQQESIENKNALATCHVSQQPLNYSLPIVSCPYGRLYQKEAAVEALLRRTSSSCSDTLGSHIRGLKDLYEVRFHLTNSKPTCPVTGVELNDKHPAFLIRNTSSSINVLSERARKEVGMEVLQAEYGPFDESEDILRLAPNVEMLQEMQEKLIEKRETEKSTKKSKKDGKKRKKLESSGGELSKKKKQKQGVAEAARARVATAVASNPTLSSLFASDKKSGVSEKEKNDNLFART